MKPLQTALSTLATVAMAGFMLAASVGCETTVDVQNAAPRATWMAIVPDASGDGAEIVVWLSDVEGDAVDLDLRWRSEDGTRCGCLVFGVGSYGLLGLPTREAVFDRDGQPSSQRWAYRAFDNGANVPNASASCATGELNRTLPTRMMLIMRPDDQPFGGADGDGLLVRTPVFDRATGLPQAVELEPTGADFDELCP